MAYYGENRDSDNLKQRRNRGMNFTKEEELILVLEVEKYREIIECKASDKISNTEKNEVWKKIQISFNSKNYLRSVQQLKVKYDNLKIKARKISADIKNCTDGGPIKSVDIEPVVEAMLRIMNKVPVDNTLDCHVQISNEKLLWADPINDEPTIIKVEAQADDAVLNTMDSQINATDAEDETVREPVCEVNETDTIEKLNFVNEYVPSTSQDVCVNRISSVKKPPNIKNWNSYTHKLKTPMTRKLRTVAPLPIKEEYYKTKIRLMEEEIKKNVIEQEELLSKRKREEEEHEKKMKLLDLDIKLKEKMLAEK